MKLPEKLSELVGDRVMAVDVEFQLPVNALTPTILLSILPSSCYRFSLWISYENLVLDEDNKNLPDKFEYSPNLFAE